jgi:hypothetical protein
MTIRIAILLFLSLTVARAVAVELNVSPDHSTTGSFNLSWQGEQGERFRLFDLTDDKGPRLIYQGRDTARVMTGLPDGYYRYRVEGESSRSELKSVTVAHHSLARAFAFFGVGLLVFVATLWLVVRGERGL